MVDDLVESINDFFGCDAAYFGVNPYDLATHLIEFGAIKPPCKVGDTVWCISQNGQDVYATCVERISYDMRDGLYLETVDKNGFDEEDFGKVIFFTETSLKALKEESE